MLHHSSEVVPGQVVQRSHPEAGHHRTPSLFGQQLVPHHLFGFERMLRLTERPRDSFTLHSAPSRLTYSFQFTASLNGAVTHHLEVIKHGCDLLHSFHHFLWSIGILRLPCHHLIQSHLPTHGRVLHLRERERERKRERRRERVNECVWERKRETVREREEDEATVTFPWRCRLFCRNSLTSSCVSFC